MPRRPNILLLMTDQQRWDALGHIGAWNIQTPNLDRLAREGATFEQCHCSAPSCVPSRASFFNCRYPHEIGVYENADIWTTSWVKDLQAAGYHTVNVGKMHTVPFDAPCGFDQRFVVENKDRPLHLEKAHGGFYDEWDKYLLNNGIRKPSRHTYKAEYPDYEDALGAYPWQLDERYHPDVFVGNLARWIIEQRQSRSPFFLQVGFPGPHPPYDPPERFLDLYRDQDQPIPEVSEDERTRQPPAQQRYRQEMIEGNHDAVHWQERPNRDALLRLRRHYAANLTLIDEQIGLTLEAMRGKGYLDDCIVLFTSDHGDCLGDHGHIQKWTMYDCITRVPAILWSPGRVPTRTIDGLFQQMDLAPALFELAGMEMPDPGSALSVLPALQGNACSREHVFAEHGRCNMLPETKRMTMVRSRDWKLVHYLDESHGELYDLQQDPDELRNRWDDTGSSHEKHHLIRVMEGWRTPKGSVT